MPEQVVAGVMSALVVELLEVVEVKQRDAQLRVVKEGSISRAS